MMTVSNFLITAVLLLFSTVFTQAALASNPLAVGDKVSIRVVAWDKTERQFELWTAVSGEYSVQPDGVVMVPLVGAITSVGMTRMELASHVASALQSRTGMIESPSVAVEMISYAPYYIYGDVANPGAYAAAPGLTALQAFALAGGTSLGKSRSSETANNLRDAGAYTQVLSEISRLQIRAVRMEAELEKLTSFETPSSITHPTGPATVERFAQEEQSILTARLTGFDLEVSNLEGLIELLETEISSVERRLVGTAAQVAMSQDEVAKAQSLLDRGIGRANQLNSAQSALFELQGKELELENNIFRAKQRIKEAERDLVSLQTKREADIVQQLQTVRANIETAVIRRDMLANILLENDAGAETTNIVMVDEFVVMRSDADGAPTTLVGRDVSLKSGDILEVTRVPITQ